MREKSEALRSFDPGFAANFVLKKGPFKVSIALIRHKKKSDFWVFYETQQRKSSIGQDWGHYMVDAIGYWPASIAR